MPTRVQWILSALAHPKNLSTHPRNTTSAAARALTPSDTPTRTTHASTGHTRTGCLLGFGAHRCHGQVHVDGGAFRDVPTCIEGKLLHVAGRVAQQINLRNIRLQPVAPRTSAVGFYCYIPTSQTACVCEHACLRKYNALSAGCMPIVLHGAHRKVASGCTAGDGYSICTHAHTCKSTLTHRNARMSTLVHMHACTHTHVYACHVTQQWHRTQCPGGHSAREIAWARLRHRRRHRSRVAYRKTDDIIMP